MLWFWFLNFTRLKEKGIILRKPVDVHPLMTQFWRKRLFWKNTKYFGKRFGPSGTFRPISNFPNFCQNKNSLELLNIIFENSSTIGSFWANKKKLEFSLLSPDSWKLLTTALKCNFSLKALPDLPLLPQFYKDVLDAWEEIVIYTPKARKEIKDEILWNNHLITIDGKSVFNKEWYNAGVRNFSDKLNEERKFMSFSEFTRK